MLPVTEEILTMLHYNHFFRKVIKLLQMLQVMLLLTD